MDAGSSAYGSNIGTYINNNSLLNASQNNSTYNSSETRPFNFGVNWIVKL